MRTYGDRIGNYKIGDLVRMSAYGSNLGANQHHKDFDSIGLIVAIYPQHEYPLSVHWIGGEKWSEQDRPPKQFWHKELKMVKK
jgi:hypothetical protein